MFRSSHFKSYLRFLTRNKLYSAITIFGFAFSLSFVILIGLYIRDEYSIDRYHVHKDRIYWMDHDGNENFAAPLAIDLQNRFPEIEAFTRIRNRTGLVQAKENGELAEANFLMVDPAFFQMFSFATIAGDSSTFLHDKNGIVLTESYARTLFGDESAIGKSIASNFQGQLFVCGVVADFERSHLKNPQIVASFELLRGVMGDMYMDTYGSWASGIYLLERRGADLKSRREDISAYMDGHLRVWEGMEKEKIGLHNLRQAYFNTNSLPPDYARTNSPALLIVMMVTGLLILAFAVINYVNLSVAQAGFRMKESALRHLLGAPKREGFGQFILESVFTCVVSLAVAFLLAYLFTPYFQSVLRTDVSLSTGLSPLILVIITTGTILLGLLAGLVPAVVTSRFRLIELTGGKFQRKTKMVYSKGLIVVQYCATIVLLACSVTIVRQVNYMTSGEIGYNTENIVNVSTYLRQSEMNPMREKLLALHGVEQVGFCRFSPASDYNYYPFWDQDENMHLYIQYCGDSVFMQIMGFEVIHRTGVEDPDAVWLSETAWKTFGLSEEAIDFCYVPGDIETHYRIRGKIRDFHNNPFAEKIDPIMILPLQEGERASNLMIRVSPGDPAGTFRRIYDTFAEAGMGGYFKGRFMDQIIADQYTSQTRISRMLGSLTLLALILSSLGMMAMAAYFARQRGKEVAVRKVFGSLTGEVLSLLMLYFMKLVILAFVIAVPITWYLMREWLMGYAYRIDLSWTIFLFAGLTAITIAGLTVFWQSLKTANRNPVLSLRSE